MSQLIEILSELLEGFGYTVLLFVITLVFSIPLGLLVCFGSLSKFKPLKYLIKGIIWVIRGTPLMLQILVCSMIPMMFNIMNKDLASALNISISSLLFLFVCVAFVINYACYFSEIYRAGIESVSKSQYEAGKVLGMNKQEVFFKIVLPQVIKRILPPMSNEIITLVKDTSLAQILGVIELLNAANHAVNHYVILTPFLYAAIFYLLFNGLVTIGLSKLEKKLNYYSI